MTEESTVQPTEERWVYAGARVNGAGKRVNAWLPEGETEGELCFKSRTGYAIGYVYTVTVERSGDGLMLYYNPGPQYTGERVSDEECARLRALDRIAEAKLGTAKAERAAKRDDKLAEMIAPLHALVWAKLTHGDRAALIRYIESELWRPRKF